MTYIEFFDRNSVENICSCLVGKPERVILVGGNRKILQKYSEIYAEVLSAKGKNVEFLCRSVNRNSLESTVKVFSEIVESYENCIFDLSGGDEIYLAASGIVCERYKEKCISLHRFNIKSGIVTEYDCDGADVHKGDLPELTVEENVRIYGGTVINADSSYSSANITPSFAEDIDAMWDICKKDVKAWNAQVNFFESLESKKRTGAAPLTVSVSEKALSTITKKYYNREIIKDLLEKGLLKSFCEKDGALELVYKNSDVKKALTKAGLALELKITLAASRCTEKEKAVYSDVKNGVQIDWDGKASSDGYDTENEIDVMMMSGVVPVFVSCKNGFVEIDELYKLSSVALRFGGRYAKKVLVATALDKTGETAHYFRQRAYDMNILLIENIQSMSENELSSVISGIAKA